ncbi:MAG TPA: A/G-specific adenine glycosylase [Planctomicrobium sp.]|nr:A/G-specific adenine glycosylase [Planctomicrobium sp.]
MPPRKNNSAAPIAEETFHLLERFTPQVCRSLRTRLIKWYGKQARPLPWRESRDPYRIWISEIMLQQTTVKAVIPYYERFLSRFPTVQTLAAATEEEVLKHWEGLGYYSRGRNIHRAAQMICTQYDESFPEAVDEIQKLPGIGRYTAGAISSFAFDRPAPIVEANTLRLYCRLLGYDGDPRSKGGQELLWEFATRIQPKDQAGLLNQALMELGSLVCTPASPNCENCPVQEWCAAFVESRQSEIPAPKVRPEITQTVEATVAIQCQNQFLIRQRQSDERWAGMWDFPRFPVESITPEEKFKTSLPSLFHREVISRIRSMSEVDITDLNLETEIRHSVTRYRIRLICCSAQLDEKPLKSLFSNDASWRWESSEALASLPMPITGRRFANHLIRTGIE